MFLGFDYKEFFQNLFEKVEDSFKKSTRGEEDLKILIRYWGIAAYLFFYFIVKKLMDSTNLKFLDVIIAAFSIVYFSWHIYAMYKCKPKKTKLTKEEKNKMKKDRVKRLSRSFTRKLLLQESVSKWDPVTITIVADLFFVLTFLSYLT
jgi:hypothetical protein